MFAQEDPLYSPSVDRSYPPTTSHYGDHHMNTPYCEDAPYIPPALPGYGDHASAVVLGRSASTSGNRSTPYSCDKCSYSAPTKSALQVHYRRHTGEKPFHCSLCPYSSTNQANLDRHVKRHTGEKPYGCPYCPHRGIEKKNVIFHIRTKHPESPCDSSSVLKHC